MNILDFEKKHVHPCDGIYFEELNKADVIRVRKMRQMLSEHS
ncbi:hypothetical protein acsn021_22690 [Anaerocolumna cellulosilytica]|uniref:Uncharacterized protein n=1 Tax=Anaerocolumna cellulosilytica TaxID=433286 RepID=A0A6S6R5J8_9FIRM|nr:hypothetical protein [Anaerocolumna cellulosilytica]MBB5194084.1 hypothetical protein [Anaerocolumna cellulosilytica]BCJ94700.1 hypothetical protein acsn021_22690 [Anaerocolumna cellulosilytica]